MCIRLFPQCCVSCDVSRFDKLLLGFFRDAGGNGDGETFTIFTIIGENEFERTCLVLCFPCRPRPSLSFRDNFFSVIDSFLPLPMSQALYSPVDELLGRSNRGFHTLWMVFSIDRE